MCHMNKLGLFIAVVLLGVFGVLVLSNQVGKKSDTQTLSVLPTTQPTPAQETTPQPTEEALPTTTVSTTPSPEINVTKGVIKTSKGDIEVEFYTKEAPNTVANFAKKAQTDFYKNLTFHRVEGWVVQGGDPLGNGTGGGNMPVEFNDKPFVVGSLGIASRGDGKVQNDAQFFITKETSSHLNGAYTNFGIVTKGMDVVNKIAIGDKILGVTVE